MSLVHLRWYHLCQTLGHCIFQCDQRDGLILLNLLPPTEGIKRDSHLLLKSLVSWCNLGKNHRFLLEAWEENHPKSNKEGAERTWISGLGQSRTLLFCDMTFPHWVAPALEDRLHFLASCLGYPLLLHKLPQHSEAQNNDISPFTALR